MTPARAFLLSLALALAVQVGLYYSLPVIGADGSLILAVEVIWLCVSSFLALLFVNHFEHDGGDDSGD